jgi:hypothetical protein
VYFEKAATRSIWYCPVRGGLLDVLSKEQRNDAVVTATFATDLEADASDVVLKAVH